MLIEYYENLGLDVGIVSVGLRRPNITFYRHLSVSWTPICLLDVFYFFYYILALYPISVIVFQRKKLNLDCDVICFHLVRAIQLNVIRNEKKKLELDFCENLSENFFLRAKAGGSNIYKRLFLFIDALLLRRFHKELKFSRFKNVYVISEFEKKIPVEKAIVITPKHKNELKNCPAEIMKLTKLFFLGHIDYEPNLRALEELVELLKQSKNNIELHVVGQISAINKSKLTQYSGTKIYGYLDEPEKIAAQCDVGFACLSIATGTQNKVYDYIAYGLPVIVSQEVWNGLSAEAKGHVMVINDLENFLIEYSAQ